MNTFIEITNNKSKVERDSGSFRDPCGQVFKISNNNSSLKIIRGINEITYEEQKELLASDFFPLSVKNGEIIPTTVFDKDLLENQDIINSWPFFLEHQTIDLVSYPYEWTFSQLKDAAILHLELLATSLENGWIIKDSTPYNIQFVNNSPIFIDTPSFTKWEEGEGWDSYRQFCMMFLYPLMLESYLNLDFRPLMKSNLDGVDPEFIYKILGLRNILKKGVISHVLLPYAVQRNILKRERDTAPAKNRRQIKHSKISVIALVDSMLSIVKRLKSKASISAWADYDHINTYEKDDNEIKKNFIENITKNNKYKTVWDCGANTGLFSEHIKNHVASIIAMDSDPIAVEKMYQRLKSKKSNINPLVMRLENMSPDHGFNSLERVRLEKRSNPNLIMCLAIIHHIRISSNVPCEIFLKYLRSLDSEIIIEFVNREDEMVVKLLMNKKEKYEDYNLESFEASVLKFFTVERTENVKGGLRKLFHLIPKH